MSLIINMDENDQIKGSPEAPILLVEYGDYECPNCAEAFLVVKELQETFGSGLGFVFRNFPVIEIHPYALNAAYIAEAAGLQNRFWDMHDIIFENQNKMALEQLLNLAESLNVDIDKLIKDCYSHRVKNKVENDLESGFRSGVNGTPSFFLNGKRYEGDHSFEAIRKAVLHIISF